MPNEYFSIITNVGLIKNAAANSPGGARVNLSHLAVGDSNGTYYNPVGTATGLKNERYRTTLTHVAIDEDNPTQLIIEGVIKEEAGPFYIREVGVFDASGDLFAIGKYPETFKPDLPAGSGKRLYIRMILGFASSPQVNLIISTDINNDPNFSTTVNNALASINRSVTDINNTLPQKLTKSENLSDLPDIRKARDNLGLGIGALAGSASENAQGIAQIASGIEVDYGADDAKIITPLKLKNSNYGKRVFLARSTASDIGFSYMAFNNLSSEFKKYEVEFIGIRPSNDGAGFACQFSTDNGVTYSSEAYLSGNNRSSTSDGINTMTNNPTRLTIVSLDNDANRGLSGVKTKGLNGLFELFDPSNPSIHKMAKWSVVYTNNVYFSYTYWTDGYGAWNKETTPVNAIRFFMPVANNVGLGGTIVAGIFNLYGIR